MFGVQRQHPQLWSLLLDHQPDLSASNSDGHNARQVAQVWCGHRGSDMIHAEDERRIGRRKVIEKVLGEGFGMAQVAVDLCMRYGGLR